MVLSPPWRKTRPQAATPTPGAIPVISSWPCQMSRTPPWPSETRAESDGARSRAEKVTVVSRPETRSIWLTGLP